MYTKILNTSLKSDSNTWLFFAKGRDGSTYKFDTHTLVSKGSKSKMFLKLRALVRDGFINTDYWRLV